MRIAVEVKGGRGGMFGGDSSSTSVTLDAIADYEVGAATVAVLNILQAHGIGDGPDVSDGDDESVGETAESDEKDDPTLAIAMTEDEHRAQHEERERAWTRDPRQHPAVSDALRSLGDAVLTDDEAERIIVAVKAGRRLGRERGIADGR